MPDLVLPAEKCREFVTGITLWASRRSTQFSRRYVSQLTNALSLGRGEDQAKYIEQVLYTR